MLVKTPVLANKMFKKMVKTFKVSSMALSKILLIMASKRTCCNFYCLRMAPLSTRLDYSQKHFRIPLQKTLKIIRKDLFKERRRDKLYNSSKQPTNALCLVKRRKLKRRQGVPPTKSKSSKTSCLTCSHHSSLSSIESSSTEPTPVNMNSELKRRKR